MDKKSVKAAALKQINQLFDQAKKNPDMGKRYVILARKIAMKFNIKLPKELKSKYCHHCYSYLTPKNSKIRIKKTMKTVRCLECNHYNRIKISN